MPSRRTTQIPNGIMKTWVENFIAHRPLLCRVIGRLVRPDEIEDIVQETFVHSYAAAHNQHIRNPRAFMLVTARNIALNHLNRSDRKLNCSFEDMCLAEDGGFGGGSLEEQCQSEEKFLIFCHAVAELPVNCRRVFILKKVYGLSQKEIAEYLGISTSTVEKHIAKGMTLTARYMQRQGHEIGGPDLPREAFYPDEVQSL